VPSVAAARRHDLTDVQWAVLEPLLPVGTGRDRPRSWTMRLIIDGIRWRVRTGSPWRDVPAGYPPWQTLYRWFRRWQRDGVWAQILALLQVRADAGGLIGWTVSVDSTIQPRPSARGRSPP